MSVVRIRRSGGKVVQDCDVYIGRRLTMSGWNLKCSKWANPYGLGKNMKNSVLPEFRKFVQNVLPDSLEEVLSLYREYILDTGLIGDIHELEGKTLGCWCKPKPCHGDILVELLNR